MNLDYLEMLVDNFKSGDKTSVQIILDEFKPFISCYSKKIHHSLRCGYEVCDIENECYIVLLSTINNFNLPSSKFVFYAMSSIKRSCITLIRYWQYRNKVSSIDNNEMINNIPTDFFDEPFQKLSDKYDSEFIKKSLKALPRKDEELLRLIFFDGISVAEYARQKGISYNTAHWQKKKALTKARYLN